MARVLGYSWSAIQRAQQGGKLSSAIDVSPGDYGADPLGNGEFRMVPSGDVVSYEERERRLAKRRSAA